MCIRDSGSVPWLTQLHWRRNCYRVSTTLLKYSSKLNFTWKGYQPLAQPLTLRTRCIDFGVHSLPGEEPCKKKIVIDNNVLEQVLHFNYLGCDISCRKGNDIERKLSKFSYPCGTIRRRLKHKMQRDTRLKFYKVVAVPTLIYGCCLLYTSRCV